MEFKIKNLKFISSRSEETLCFNCMLYIDNIKVAEVDNDGCGGENRVYILNQEKYDAFEKYVDSLPAEWDETFEREFKTSVDTFLSLLVAKEIDLQEKRKNFNKGICYAKSSDSGDYMLVQWRKPIQWMLDNNQTWVLQNKVNELIAQGFVILNDNLTDVKITK